MNIAPQCEFAATKDGSSTTPDDQRRKLDLIAKVAEQIRGGV